MCAVQRESGWFFFSCVVTFIDFQNLEEKLGYQKLEIELLTFEAVSVNFILECAFLETFHKTLYRNMTWETF